MKQTTGVHALVRSIHEQRVLVVLRERGPVTRGELAQHIGLSRSTLSVIVTDLLERGAVVIADNDSDVRVGSGRPAERIALNPGSGQFMGVDFGHLRVHVADASHEISASESAPYATPDWNERIEIAFALADRISAEHGVHYRALQGVGIGVPGLGDRYGLGPRRLSQISANLTRRFGDRFGIPVHIDNNTRFAALAEAITAAPPADAESAVHDLAYIRLDEGVGGGLIVGRHLVAGATGNAGELGHVRVQTPGRACRCGKSGCLETIASLPNVLRIARERGAGLDSVADLARAAENGDPVVRGVIDDAAQGLSTVLATLVTMLDPSRVMVGGELVRIAPGLIPQAAAYMRSELQGTATAAPPVVPASLGGDDGAIGAIAYLLRGTPLLSEYPWSSMTASTTGTALRRRSA